MRQKLAFPDIYTFYNTRAIKILWYWCMNRKTKVIK